MSYDPLNERMRTGPQHHLHGDTEPLPGSKGATTTTDYTPETIYKEGITQTQPAVHHPVTQPSSNMDNILPQQYEGVRHENVKPKMGDKIVGKAEEVMGKVTHNPQLQEKGAERAHRDTSI